MSSEELISWEFLKNVADALDSYRIRALIDSKKEILEAGIYTEKQYYSIIFKIFDEEMLKQALYTFLKQKYRSNFYALREFAELRAIDIKKVFSLLELLKNEKLVNVEEIIDHLEGDDNNPSKSIFRDLSITCFTGDVSQIRTSYEPVKVIFDAKVCSGCGTCAGICPVNCLNVYNGFGKIDLDKCIRCGFCHFVCPRSYLPTRVLSMFQDNSSEIKDYEKIGPYLKVYSARTKINEIREACQDGGISSTCLHYLFNEQKIDLALGAKMSNTIWRPDPLLLQKKEDVLLTAGTKYVNNATLRLLNQGELSGKKLAIVGVPCQMQALLKSKIYDIGIPSLNSVEYRIGIFCMESFSYPSLLKICEILNVNVNDAKKMNINKGKFFIYTKNGEELSVPIKEISHLAREDCEVCYDLTSESADISVGSIGSPAGWNTVIIRTDKGKELYEELIINDLIESKEIKDVKPGLPLLQKIADSKKNKCKKHISQKESENQRIPHY